MKTFLPSLLLLSLTLFSGLNGGNAQVVSDDFSDGEFTSNPSWAGDAGIFTVNAQNELQLVDAVADQSYLATSFTSTSLDNKEWRLFIRQSFSGSDANQSRTYFAASAPAMAYSGSGSAGVTGYFFKLGEGGSGDVLRIYKDDGAAITELASCTTNISASFAIGIKITRDDAGNWNVFIDPAGGTNYQSEASFNDATYNSAAALGFICSYTSSNADNFFFDTIYFGDVVVDTTPPSLVSTTAISNTAVDVVFSEPVEETSAEATSHYSVSGIGAPSSAQLDGVNNALVHLTFGTAFNDNQEYTLEVSTVEDLEGNAMTASSADFIWFVPATPAYRSVVFNEVLADPSPVVGLPDVEFVELFNASEDAFDLAGWQLVNTSTPKTLSSYILAPGGHVVLCDANEVGEFSNALGITSFTALTNDSDSLTLLDAEGNVIDLLVYDIDWYASAEKSEGGWSLEQINPFLPCGNSAINWSESSNANGGTPALQNSVFDDTPDTSIPEIVAAEIVGTNQLLVTLSEPMNELSLEDIGFTMVFFTASSIEWTSGLDGLLFTFTTDLNPEEVYSISITGLTDCNGNMISAVPFEFQQGSAPEAGELIINEIYPDPDEAAGVPLAEYVELYNKGDRVLNLQGIYLNNGFIEEHILLSPDSFIVVADASDANAFFFQFYNKAFMESFPSLTNSGLQLLLKDANENTLDEVNYDISWYHDADKDDGGWSLELVNPQDPCSVGDNWNASNASAGGTPGKINSVFDDSPDTTSPEIVYVLSEPQESITILFNEPIDAASLAGLDWTVNGEVQSGINPQLANSEGTAVVLYYGEMEPGVIYSFDLGGLTDCWGNDVGLIQSQFALAETAQAGDLIINEILFNPYEGGKDFIEVYNNSLRNISLAGWKLADATNGQMNEGKEISEIALMIYPGEYVVLTEAGTPLNEFYPGTKTDRVIIVEDVPDFSSEDVVYLLMPLFNVASDSVPYSEDMHFPLLNSTDGVSLERIAFNRSSTDPTNWHSASEYVSFATPGYVNSQSDNSSLSSDASFEVINELFSPDNDGYQDVTTFSYAFTEPGYVGNIVIYDSEGREVKKLMRSELLGTSGTISWDGFNDERQKAPMGIYVVYFEVFNLEGNISSFKKPCVLAHSLD